MAMKRRPRAVGDIDVNSFSDIAFLLIIFFILTTSFSNIMGREMRIPAGQKPDNPDQKVENKMVNLSPTEIHYGVEGATDTRSLSFVEFRDLLYQEKFEEMATDTARTVIVATSEDVTYERYFQVLTAISNAGGIVAIVEETKAGEGNL